MAIADKGELIVLAPGGQRVGGSGKWGGVWVGGGGRAGSVSRLRIDCPHFNRCSLVNTFGEDKRIDALIRKFGYRTTPEILKFLESSKVCRLATCHVLNI